MNTIAFWRKERRLSQIELAEASSVPRYLIQLHEQNIRPLDLKNLEKVAEVLGLKVFGEILEEIRK